MTSRPTGIFLSGDEVARHVDQGHPEQNLGIVRVLGSHIKPMEDFPFKFPAACHGLIPIVGSMKLSKPGDECIAWSTCLLLRRILIRLEIALELGLKILLHVGMRLGSCDAPVKVVKDI